ncbi:MAG: AAA family ATPase [Planctomycetia bacterium]|nr:AAA family ATPase [Planctomycetia bacterium]
MPGLTFRPAARTQNRLKMALDGPAGSGKTFTALRLGHSLGDEVFVIDTQYGAAALYAGENIDGKVWNFKHLTLSQHDVDHYQNAISAAEKQGADVIVIDSLSNAWDDCGGILDQVERKSEKNFGRAAEGNVLGMVERAALYKKHVRVILASPCHVIATLRTRPTT